MSKFSDDNKNQLTIVILLLVFMFVSYALEDIVNQFFPNSTFELNLFAFICCSIGMVIGAVVYRFYSSSEFFKKANTQIASLQETGQKLEVIRGDLLGRQRFERVVTYAQHRSFLIRNYHKMTREERNLELNFYGTMVGFSHIYSEAISELVVDADLTALQINLIGSMYGTKTRNVHWYPSLMVIDTFLRSIEKKSRSRDNFKINFNIKYLDDDIPEAFVTMDEELLLKVQALGVDADAHEYVTKHWYVAQVMELNPEHGELNEFTKEIIHRYVDVFVKKSSSARADEQWRLEVQDGSVSLKISGTFSNNLYNVVADKDCDEFTRLTSIPNFEDIAEVKISKELEVTQGLERGLNAIKDTNNRIRVVYDKFRKNKIE